MYKNSLDTQQRKSKRTLGIMVALIVVVFIGAGIGIAIYFSPNNVYARAINLLEQGQHREALDTLSRIIEKEEGLGWVSNRHEHAGHLANYLQGHNDFRSASWPHTHNPNHTSPDHRHQSFVEAIEYFTLAGDYRSAWDMIPIVMEAMYYCAIHNYEILLRQIPAFLAYLVQHPEFDPSLSSSLSSGLLYRYNSLSYSDLSNAIEVDFSDFWGFLRTAQWRSDKATLVWETFKFLSESDFRDSQNFIEIVERDVLYTDGFLSIHWIARDLYHLASERMEDESSEQLAQAEQEEQGEHEERESQAQENGAGANENIIGTWHNREGGIDSYAIFHEDGTFEVRVYIIANQAIVNSGRYFFDDGVLVTIGGALGINVETRHPEAFADSTDTLSFFGGRFSKIR